jgi:hypothetical protein
MKKLKQTFRQFGDDFEKATAKELLHYATLINKLQIKRYFSASYKIVKMGCILIIVSLCLTSCATQKGIPKKELFGLDKNFSESFGNKSVNVVSGGVESKLSTLFKIKSDTLHGTSIKMEVKENGDLKINYTNENGEKDSKIFKGKLRKRDYKLFLVKKRVFILPVIWWINVERIKISLTKDSTLVVKKYSNYSGMILMGAGDSWKEECYFKNIKTKS